MYDDEFIGAVFEIAFGENAIHRGFTHDEVLARLREFSDAALTTEVNMSTFNGGLAHLPMHCPLSQHLSCSVTPES